MTIEKFTAFAQFTLSVIWMVGYFVVLGLMITGEITIAASWEDTVKQIMSFLGSTLIVIVAYWFQRQRPSGETQNETVKPN